mmetsp:Transcript_31097/g.52715  ORF Transcript_31097/g.52715 Transcript_31097/m.52715 type:complete len:112 (-) Transcript_31097:184-519(-)
MVYFKFNQSIKQNNIYIRPDINVHEEIHLVCCIQSKQASETMSKKPNIQVPISVAGLVHSSSQKCNTRALVRSIPSNRYDLGCALILVWSSWRWKWKWKWKSSRKASLHTF